MSLNFSLGEQDSQLMLRLVRALAGHNLFGAMLIAREMDLVAVHNQDTALDLGSMVQVAETGPDHEQWACLMHDIAGIRDNLDRNTGKLRNHFSPRFAKPESPKQPVDYTPRVDKQRRR